MKRRGPCWRKVAYTSAKIHPLAWSVHDKLGKRDVWRLRLHSVSSMGQPCRRCRRCALKIQDILDGIQGSTGGYGGGYKRRTTWIEYSKQFADLVHGCALHVLPPVSLALRAVPPDLSPALRPVLPDLMALRQRLCRGDHVPIHLTHEPVMQTLCQHDGPP